MNGYGEEFTFGASSCQPSGKKDKVALLEQQVQNMNAALAPQNALSTADLSGCQEGDGLVKTWEGWTCQPQSGPGLATLTKYLLNSACKVSNFGTFRWNQNSNQCTGSGGTYTVSMNDVVPESSWADQVESAGTLVCWK
jgi:hypothetical protein